MYEYVGSWGGGGGRDGPAGVRGEGWAESGRLLAAGEQPGAGQPPGPEGRETASGGESRRSRLGAQQGGYRGGVVRQDVSKLW